MQPLLHDNTACASRSRKSPSIQIPSKCLCCIYLYL